jgi:hypothetical protein
MEARSEKPEVRMALAYAFSHIHEASFVRFPAAAEAP